jgi:transposase
MGDNFLPCERDPLHLMPPALQDWLPEGDLAWFILDAVAQMKLAAIERTYRADGWGQAAYEPATMVALLLYVSGLGERSSRRIERLCERDLAFRVITANRGPDHTTLARFRQTHETEMAKLFTQVLRLCAEAGLVKVGGVALDGTKVKADAALAANRTAEMIEQAVITMLAEAHTVDEAEDCLYGMDRRGDELPEVLRERRSRLARLQACQERLTRRRPRRPRSSRPRSRRARPTKPPRASRSEDANRRRPRGGGRCRQGERDGSREPHHEDTGRVRARLQCPGGGDGGPAHRGGWTGSHSTWIRPRTYRAQSTAVTRPRPCVLRNPWGDSLRSKKCAANPSPPRLYRRSTLLQLPFIG